MTNAILQRRWPVFALIACAAILGIAHGFETFGGYEPCQLCLRQREVYWAAGGVAAAAIAVAFFWRSWNMSRLADAILGLVFLTGAVVAAYHAGVEWKFWPGPATCSGGALSGLDSGDILNALSRKGHAPSCEDAAWRLAGVSMAGYNVLISLALAGLSFFAAAAPQPQADDHA